MVEKIGYENMPPGLYRVAHNDEPLGVIEITGWPGHDGSALLKLLKDRSPKPGDVISYEPVEPGETNHENHQAR